MFFGPERKSRGVLIINGPEGNGDGKNKNVGGGAAHYRFSKKPRRKKPAHNTGSNRGYKYIQEDFGKRHVFGLHRFFYIAMPHLFQVEKKNDQANDQTDTGGGKGIAPAVLIAQVGRYEIAHKGTDVDAHIKNVVGIIFQWLQVISIVNIPQQRRYVGFKKAIADNDQS